MRAFAFERIQQSGLFAADVTASAGVNVNLETVARSKNVAAKIVACIVLRRSRGQRRSLAALVLASQKYVTDVGLNRICGDDHAFDQLVRIASPSTRDP